MNICNFWIDIYYWKKSQHTHFWWEKLAVFQTRFLKTDHCAPERHRHQSHGYGNGFTKLFNSERWWVWESLCFFPFFSHFSLFVFFIQSEKVNVAALQFCNCFHIHSIQFNLMSVTDFKFSGITTKTTRESDSPLKVDFFQKVWFVFKISEKKYVFQKTILNLKFKFQAQDSFFWNNFFLDIWRSKKWIELSEKKPPLVVGF